MTPELTPEAEEKSNWLWLDALEQSMEECINNNDQCFKDDKQPNTMAITQNSMKGSGGRTISSTIEASKFE